MTDNLDEFEETPIMVEPLILEIYLNNNNYKDRLLINDFKKRAQIVRIDNIDPTSFFVKVEEVEQILYEKYRSDILNFDSTSPSTLSTTANSIFFIEAMMREFRRLRYFRVHISNTDKKKDTSSPVKFEYKIMHSRIDISNNASAEMRKKCKRIFQKIGVYNPTIFNRKPYFEIAIRELFYKLDQYSMNFDREDEEVKNIGEIMGMIGPKLEIDNATALFIMEK